MQKKTNELISVIVPIYNAEPWLKQCIESISAQTYRELDIILVNDGSTDRSCDICEKYAASDERIRVLTKANSGVSESRNVGIEAARGKYITFVDADDYLPGNILKDAVEVMEKEQTALCAWNLSCVRDGAILPEKPIQQGHVDRMTAITATVYDRCAAVPLGRYFRASWAKMYRKELIDQNKLRFSTQQRIGEDALFLLEYLQYAEQIYVIDTVGYFYRITDASAVRRHRTDLLQQNQCQLDAICSYLERSTMVITAQLQTAVTCLAWDMFCRLIRNQMVHSGRRAMWHKEGRADAQAWFARNKRLLRRKSIIWETMPRTTKLQYILSAFLPVGIICRVSALLMHK